MTILSYVHKINANLLLSNFSFSNSSQQKYAAINNSSRIYSDFSPRKHIYLFIYIMWFFLQIENEHNLLQRKFLQISKIVLYREIPFTYSVDGVLEVDFLFHPTRHSLRQLSHNFFLILLYVCGMYKSNSNFGAGCPLGWLGWFMIWMYIP